MMNSLGKRRKTVRPVRSPEGYMYLNIGCGSNYHREWTNIDLYSNEHVRYHNITKPLPYDDSTFDAVYSSHVLEHLRPSDAAVVVSEANRVLKAQGVIRLVVPDLEEICREYLRQLDDVSRDWSPTALRRYNWIKLELLDQLVRERPGGLMLDALREGVVDDDYVRLRMGDEAEPWLRGCDGSHPMSDGATRDGTFFHRLTARLPSDIRDVLYRTVRNPRRTGEAHRWMHDRVSLQILLEAHGFDSFRVCAYRESAIPFWDKYNLDESQEGGRPRKPDSLFVEALKALDTATLERSRGAVW